MANNDTIIRVSVDASGVEAGTDRAKRSWDAYMAKQSEVAALTIAKQKAIDEAIANGSQASARQINSYMQSLDKLSSTYGRSKSEQLTLQAATLGVLGTAQPMIDKVAAMEAAMRGAGGAAVTMAESEEQASARIAAMVQASLAAAAAMSDQGEVAARYAASVAEVAAAATAAERANAGLATSSEAVATAQTAAAAQARVASTVISDGAAKVTEALGRQLTALTATEAQMAVYDAQMAGYTEAEVAQIGAIAKEVELRKQQIALAEEMAAAYAVETRGAHGAAGATAGVTAEIGVLGREAASGNWSRFASSFTRLLSLARAMDLLLNPLSLSIAAIGYSMYKVAEQNAKMNEALALTGSYAGITADQLRGMASEATANGAAFNTAAEAVTELAAKGRLTGEEIANLGKTAADMATYTSMSVKQMVDEFTKLADEPVKASVKLNDQYHYLTESTYDQIVALEKQGDATGAAQVAVEAFSRAMDERTQEIAKNEGIILKGWRDIKGAINDAMEAVGSFGAAASPAQVVARMQANKSARLPIGQWDSQDEADLQKAIAAQQAAEKAAAEKGAREREQQQRIDAKHSYDTWNQQFATPAEKRAREIQSYLDKIATPLGLSLDQQLADEAKINEKYKDPKTAKPKAFHDDASTRFIQQLRDQAAELQEQLSTTTKITAAEKERAKFNQQVSDWKGKVLTADQKSLIGHQIEIRVQLQKNIELEKEVKHREDVAKLQERSAQLAQSITAYQKGQSEQYARELDAIGMGADAQKNVQAIKSIYKEYQRLQEQLDKATPKDLIGGPDYQKAVGEIQAGLQQSLQDYDEYYATLKEKQANWINGASTALSNYMDESQNKMKQTEQLFNTVTNGMESAWVNFTQTGKLSFTSLVNSIIADLARMSAKAAISGLLGNFASIGGSLIGGFFGANAGVAAPVSSALPGDSLDNMINLTNGFGTGHADGGYITGPGSGTSDSIMARLSNGEFVVNAAATSKYRGLLEAINSKQPVAAAPRFATGGYVGSSTPVSGSSSNSMTVIVDAPVTVTGGNGTSAAEQQNSAELSKKIKQAVQALLQNERRQGGVLWKLQNGLN